MVDESEEALVQQLNKGAGETDQDQKKKKRKKNKKKSKKVKGNPTIPNPSSND